MARVAAALATLAVLPGCATTSITNGDTQAAIAAPSGYRLVWNDEFDRAGRVDPAKWSYDIDSNRKGWGNGEQQYYSNRPENVRVERGVLVIEARREPDVVARAPDGGGQGYTSARLTNPAGLGWQYGYFEVRAKLPCGRGSWPAIWLLPSNPPINWPMGGEIDVMEHVGHQPNVINATVHTGAYNHRLKTNKGVKLKLDDVCNSFHLYQMRWTADAIEIGVDGTFFHRFDNDKAGRVETWPFAKPFNVVLNVAVGGKWGGQKGIDDTAFPQAMEVDYVRVFQPIKDTPR